MFQTVTAVDAEPDRVADRLGDGTGEHEAERDDRGEHDGHEGDERACSGRSFQIGRPSSIS